MRGRLRPNISGGVVQSVDALPLLVDLLHSAGLIRTIKQTSGWKKCHFNEERSASGRRLRPNCARCRLDGWGRGHRRALCVNLEAVVSRDRERCPARCVLVSLPARTGC